MGREFDNNVCYKFFENIGMQFRFSCPHTSSQNGKAKRMIRTLNDITRYLLAHACMPPSYWVEALLWLHTSITSSLLQHCDLVPPRASSIFVHPHMTIYESLVVYVFQI